METEKICVNLYEDELWDSSATYWAADARCWIQSKQFESDIS